MDIFRTVSALRAALKGRQVAFVPTMGALHEGHLDLVRAAKGSEQGVYVVCSIFVNPTQFGDAADLAKYPRTEESDCEKLASVGCDAVFLPSVEEIYPADWQTPPFDFGYLDTVMEGAQRKGHFAGVGQVVHRLLSIVEPQSLYLGQKDFQQVAVIKDMVYRQLGWEHLRVNVVPTVREIDGLAMSSRNVRLSAEGRKQAAEISQALFIAQGLAKVRPHTPESLRQFVQTRYERLHLEVDYVCAVDNRSLRPALAWEDAPNGVSICVVVRIDGVRLLDNVPVFPA